MLSESQITVKLTEIITIFCRKKIKCRGSLFFKQINNFIDDNYLFYVIQNRLCLLDVHFKRKRKMD